MWWVRYESDERKPFKMIERPPGGQSSNYHTNFPCWGLLDDLQILHKVFALGLDEHPIDLVQKNICNLSNLISSSIFFFKMKQSCMTRSWSLWIWQYLSLTLLSRLVCSFPGEFRARSWWICMLTWSTNVLKGAKLVNQLLGFFLSLCFLLEVFWTFCYNFWGQSSRSLLFFLREAMSLAYRASSPFICLWAYYIISTIEHDRSLYIENKMSLG